jgi:hypothetical protein
MKSLGEVASTRSEGSVYHARQSRCCGSQIAVTTLKIDTGLRQAK